MNKHSLVIVVLKLLRYMRIGLGRKNWRGVHKQQPRKDVELYFFSHNSTNTPPVDLG